MTYLEIENARQQVLQSSEMRIFDDMIAQLRKQIEAGVGNRDYLEGELNMAIRLRHDVGYEMFRKRVSE